MKSFFLTVLAVIAFAVMPLTGFAAMTHFPVSREDILRHVLENTDAVQISVRLKKVGDAADPLRGWFFPHEVYHKSDGTEESVNALARRSVEEFEGFLIEKMRDAVNAAIDKTDASLVGATCTVGYTLW